MPSAIFLSSPALWQHGHGPSHPLKPERLRRTYEVLDEYGAFSAPGARLVPPRPAADDELAYFHEREYIDAVRALSAGEAALPAGRYGFGPGDNPVFEGMYESEALKAGSALLAAELLLRGECAVAFSFSGGLHHGAPALASGFCVFNDIAVAVHWLLRQGRRVAYVDIDVHHGDGVQDAFYKTDQVLTISLHQDGRTLFPGRGFVGEAGAGPGLGCSVNVPLPPYTDDERYLYAFDAVVPPLLERFRPDVLVTQLGVDTHYLDPLARLALTTSGHLALFERLGRLAERLQAPWLALGGGGYNLDVVPRSWALAFGVMSGQPWPEALPPGYRSRYGGQLLRDQGGAQARLTDNARLQAAVEAVVQAVRRVHNLKPAA
jgi:acetoin utilization protein AcuC